MTLNIQLPPWMAEAVCASVDPAIFFSDAKGSSPRRAKEVCAVCPVQRECLEYALDWEASPDGAVYPSGVYGGLTPHERRPLRVARRGDAA